MAALRLGSWYTGACEELEDEEEEEEDLRRRVATASPFTFSRVEIRSLSSGIKIESASSHY